MSGIGVKIENNVTLVGNGSAQKSIGQTSYATRNIDMSFNNFFKWEVDGENTAKLQEYINNDSGKNHVFKKMKTTFNLYLIKQII